MDSLTALEITVLSVTMLGSCSTWEHMCHSSKISKSKVLFNLELVPVALSNQCLHLHPGTYCQSRNICEKDALTDVSILFNTNLQTELMSSCIL